MSTLLDKLVYNDQLPWDAVHGAYAAEFADYKRALRRVQELDPQRFPLTTQDPLNLLDEAAVALANAAWHAGTAVGDAFAYAEQALTTAPNRVCASCHGYGRPLRSRLGGSGGPPFEDRDCRFCGGTGLVAASVADD